MEDGKKSIIPPTGDFSYNTWYSRFVLPQGLSGNLSVGGWTKGNEGFIQQTFLGASIRNFNISAGFGDTTSTLSVQLINDEYNKSDGTGVGLGDDVYHNGQYDAFAPPPVGTPVFFKFGKNHATIEQSWRKTFDDTYNYDTIPPDSEAKVITVDSFEDVPPYHFFDLEKSKASGQLFFEDLSDYYDPVKGATNKGRGKNHFIFGGILQSYTQNKGPDGNPVYSVQIVDPREILSNCSVILKNYAGSTFGNKNYFNVFGFLEHDPSDQLKAELQTKSQPGFVIGSVESSDNWITSLPFTGTKANNILEKLIDPTTGNVYYVGNDMYRLNNVSEELSEDSYPEFFPITGQGFARVSDQGIPWYRVRQGLEALFNYKGFLPKEYVDAGYGGPINFRGFNYVADFSGIPLDKIPQMYFMNYDQLDLLSIAQELCDVISHDLFVSLLPIIDHPASKFLYDYNKYWIRQALEFPEGSVERDLRLGKVISGIIRIDAIDRSAAPSPGSIKSYLENLASKNVFVKNQDLGYELSNVTTDKIVVGAQEVEMYYFTNAKDRDSHQIRRRNAGLENESEYLQGAQWSLDTMLKQQIIPFYGFLGKDAVTIPRGFGAYQQIMLDATGLEAYGVGNYYIATEIELRCALVSYERWKDFLLQYNNTYIEELTENQVLLEVLASKATDYVPGLNAKLEKYGHVVNWANREFGVSVPRSVFNSDKNYMGPDGLPANMCAPPYGYPLYYQRASAIGIPEAGTVGIQNAFDQLIITFSQEGGEKEQSESLNKFCSVAKEAKIELDDQIKEIQELQNRIRSGLTEIAASDRQRVIDSWNESISKLQAEKNRIDEIISTETSRIAYIKEFVKNSAGLYKNIQRTGKKTAKNARKVYDFVRGIAEKHLGKTFLVKVPKACNVFYSKELTLWDDADPTMNIKNGPFGFKPQTITSNIGYYANNGYQDDINLLRVQQTIGDSDIFEHYIYNPQGTYYTIGALKNNFNPISEKWEFNYEPEPQGGFFNFAIYNNNIPFGNIQEFNLDGNKLPPATLSLLAPKDLTNFLENGRIQCYVRFNDSQYLDFSKISKDSFIQQVYAEEGFIPDVLEELDNVALDSTDSFGQHGELTTNEGKQRTVAFVKATLDSKFYMAPKTVSKETTVWARKVEYLPNFSSFKLIENRDENGCITRVPVQPYARPIFWIENGGTDGATVENTDFLRYYDTLTNSELVVTDSQNLDPDNVYALITLPGKIEPTIETRFRDSELSSINNSKIKNIMTADVVKNVAGFDLPVPKRGKKIPIDCNHPNLDSLKFTDITSAMDAYTQVMKGMSFSAPTRGTLYSSPSPVYPDLVALPLLSKERCYGPWLSSSIANAPGDTRLRYSDIGGKVEFVKDENLAPWNYAGYQLMNEAGSLQAQFSNSLLLFSERGGFVYPEAPTGISLAKALKNGGPLVTSISVDIADSEISTTVKMDLYTSRFGKLQKQKELAIGEVVRQRQKIIDETNANIRRGMGKNATSANVGQILAAAGIGNVLNAAKQKENFYSNLEKGIEPVSQLVLQAEQRKETLRSLAGQPNQQDYNNTVTTVNGNIQTVAAAMEIASVFNSTYAAQQQFHSTAIVNVTDNLVPISNALYNPSLPTIQDNVSARIINNREQGQ